MRPDADDGTDGTVVAILAVPRAYALDVSIPAHVFGRHPGYRVLVCGEEAASPAPLSAVPEADIVVVPGYEDPHLPLPPAYPEALRAAVERGVRVVAVCTGVFVLAASGALDGRSATTHWRHTEQLRAAYPGIDVVDNRLFVQDGPLLTCAGAGAGIDACLHIVRSDFGVGAADGVAKEVISSSVREADEPQYADPFAPGRDTLRATRDWALARLGTPLTVQRMADHSLMSRRTFNRRFARETGMPPMRWVALQRILSARRLLESSDWPVERIATATGFGTAANFRTAFRRETGVTPTAYRRTHAANEQ
ncbi:DJ-1/PfpI family protein [Streptomyces albiaxialis]|uniref:DJ-1/PfpI family protein n=1 Tax=Streptomyces albiaxialis TaxID=329523 RepID=A0ABP5HJR9_9ACTN